MPRLWDDTIEAHRHHVTDAILHTTVGLVSEHGLRSVTMSEIAEQTGIGRATLYKYFSDVESILSAWHERQIDSHLKQLSDIRDQAGNAAERLAAVLEAYALITHETRTHNDSELAAALHQGAHVAKAHHHLRRMVRDLIKAAAVAGDVRTDVTVDELASYCLHALGGAARAPSKAAVRRLVVVTLDGLRSVG